MLCDHERERETVGNRERETVGKRDRRQERERDRRQEREREGPGGAKLAPMLRRGSRAGQAQDKAGQLRRVTRRTRREYARRPGIAACHPSIPAYKGAGNAHAAHFAGEAYRAHARAAGRAQRVLRGGLSRYARLCRALGPGSHVAVWPAARPLGRGRFRLAGMRGGAWGMSACRHARDGHGR